MDWNNTTYFERCFIAAVQGRRIEGGIPKWTSLNQVHSGHMGTP